MLKYLILLACVAAIGCRGEDKPANPMQGDVRAGTGGATASHLDGGGKSSAAQGSSGAVQGGNGASGNSNQANDAARPAIEGGRSGNAGGQSAANASQGNDGDSGAGSEGGTTGTAAGAAGAGGSAPDPSAELFDPDQLPRFDIGLSDEAVSALGNDPGTYVKGTLRYGNTTLQDVGVRIKGEGSVRTLSSKAAFKIKFDEFVTNQSLLGMHRLTLNNMVQDPSFIAERLTYQVYRAALLPAPRCNNALVYVNGEFYGVYANVESEDKPFLRRWFASDAGNLYEDGQIDLEPGNEGRFDLETNETKNDRSDLTGLITALAAAQNDTLLGDLDATLDTEHFLRYSALEAAVNQWDGYSYTYFEPNNFRLYHDPSTGKFRFIPWGMDMSMKPFDATRATIALFTIGPYEGQEGARAAGGLIFKRCLESSSCKTHYASVVREMIGVYDAQKLAEAAAHHYAQVKDHVYEDFRKEVTNAEFEAAYQSVLTTIGTRTSIMQDELNKAGF